MAREKEKKIVCAAENLKRTQTDGWCGPPKWEKRG
jgi:hypothetical protein